MLNFSHAGENSRRCSSSLEFHQGSAAMPSGDPDPDQVAFKHSNQHFCFHSGNAVSPPTAFKSANHFTEAEVTNNVIYAVFKSEAFAGGSAAPQSEHVIVSHIHTHTHSWEQV